MRHLAKEALEAAADPADITEFADCLIALLDAAWRAGHGTKAIIEAAQAKMAVNRARVWPAPTADGPCEHVRDGGR